jgi:hypothetical protein
MPDDKTYEDKVVYLTDLLDRAIPGPAVLDGFTFLRCVLRGPAVLTMVENITLEFSTFNVPNAESMLFELPESGSWSRVGIVGISNMRISNCTLENLAFTGTAMQLESFRGTPSP